MGKARLEAFSDGVIAIIITIMVLDLKIPAGADLSAVATVIPVFLNYVLSFVYVAIYWNNHHHLLHTVQHVHGGVLWANLHLLFWLSLFPFITGWMGQNYSSPVPTALYGCVLLLAAMAYLILERVIIASEGAELAASPRGRKRGKGPHLGVALCSRDRSGILLPGRRAGVLCHRGADVAHSGPADRAGHCRSAPQITRVPYLHPTVAGIPATMIANRQRTPPPDTKGQKSDA